MVAAALAFTPMSAAAQTVPPAVARWHPLIAEAAKRLAIPESWIERVMRAESAGDTTLGGRPIRSSAGAIGLMQLMPATWATMRDRLGLGANPDDPHDNIIAGAAYLRLMYERFGYPGMFAAYNAGPGRYGAYLAGRVSLSSETIAYLAGVTGRDIPATVSPAVAPRELLFALRRDLADPAGDPANNQPGEGLFAIRKGDR